jgi:hypothetical protein
MCEFWPKSHDFRSGAALDGLTETGTFNHVSITRGSTSQEDTMPQQQRLVIQGEAGLCGSREVAVMPVWQASKDDEFVIGVEVGDKRAWITREDAQAIADELHRLVRVSSEDC